MRQQLLVLSTCLTTLFAAITFAQETKLPLTPDTREVISLLPYEVVTVPGHTALEEWERLTAQEGVTAIIVGSDEDLIRLADGFDPDYGSVGNHYTTMQYAWGLTHPESLEALRKAEWEDLLASDLARGEDSLFADSEIEDELPVGNWPETPEVYSDPGTLLDYMTGNPLDFVHIVLLPTDDPTRAPAFLRVGGWNANPPPAYHVAALTAWRDRYGAVPVVITGDVIELRVARRPETREEAMALAQEHFIYSGDIVYQGFGSLSDLAASLHASDWWYFWWD